MSRSNIVLIVLIVIVVGFLVYLSNASRDISDRSKWQFSYNYDGDERAYDRDFFIDYVKKESLKFNRLDERFSRTEIGEAKSLYFFYNRNFNIDRTEADALYDFVADGNDALIVANKFNYELFKNIRGVRMLKDDTYIQYQVFDTAITLTDTATIGDKTIDLNIITYGENPLQIGFIVDTSDIENDYYDKNAQYNWNQEEAYEYDEYDYEEEEYEYDEYEYEEDEYTYEEEPENVQLDPVDVGKEKVAFPEVNPITVVGNLSKDRANLIQVNIGEGKLFLHATPVLFTNAQFDKPEVFEYTQELFENLEYEHVYWDELSFQFLNTEDEGYGLSDKSYLEYIFKNRALKTAFYFFLIGLLVFLIVGIKRKYRAIEIVDPVTNSSIDFSKTIARLYWLNPNHRKMADQKMKMFLFEVRNRYGLTTHELNDDFKSRFKSKSGVSDKLINRLFDAYNLARNSPSIHQDVLVQISESIVQIRQQWK